MKLENLLVLIATGVAVALFLAIDYIGVDMVYLGLGSFGLIALFLFAVVYFTLEEKLEGGISGKSRKV